MLNAIEHICGKRDWPFKNMDAGEVIVFDLPIYRVAKYAHTYGKGSGKKFRTKIIDGHLHVTRVQ